MYRKLMWCYVLVLTLLDLSLNSRLTAQGKSHGVTVHESLVEGITLQEWGTASGAESAARGGRALPAGALRAWPPALALGRAALGAARAATVTITNTANTTMHLASVAGTTPDFHASFFDSKTLACGANTSFSVVYLGRREGPVSAHLYIHTSLGVHKYPVSAIGVASEWALWPMVDVRVPHNATLQPLLTMHNPTAHTVQVQEIYSSAGWLGLQLPGGAGSAPRALWAVPPHASRALVRLRIAPPTVGARAQHDTRAAYIRIRANVTGPPLVLAVEARGAPPGPHAEPLQLRAGTRGARDPPYTFEISLGNSEEAARGVAGGAWPPHCRAAPHAPPAPPAPRANGAAAATANGGTEGAQLTLLQTQLEPHQEATPAARFTLDFAKLWSSGTSSTESSAEAEAEAEAEAGAEAEEEAGAGAERWCAGWAALGGAALPYSVRLLPGTLRTPQELHFVTANKEECMKPQDINVVNEFEQPVQIVSVDYSPEILKHFEVGKFRPFSMAAGSSARVSWLRLRRADADAALDAALDVALDAALAIRTNLTHTAYTVRVKLYSGALHFEWDWPKATGRSLSLGALATSSTRRVVARVRNPAPAAVCAAPGAALPGATLALAAPAGCVPARGEASAILTVVAPARPGALSGSVWLQTEHARHEVSVTLSALAGQLRATLLPPELTEDDDPEDDDDVAAPFAGSRAWELVAESSMSQRMRLERLEPRDPDPAVVFTPPAEASSWWVGPGLQALGSVRYEPARACGARCYCGQQLPAAQAAAWRAAPLAHSLALLRRRRDMFAADQGLKNLTLHLDTDVMVRVPVCVSVRLHWPRLARAGGAAGAGGAGWAGLAGVGGAAARWLRVRNPSRTHALALRPLLAAPHPLPDGVLVEAAACAGGECEYSPGVFTVTEWRAPRGGVARWGEPGGGEGGPAQGEGEGEGPGALLLAPRALLELRVNFAPPAPSLYHAYLYLINNLTMVEPVQLAARGALARFELAGRRAGGAPILLQVPECEEGQDCSGADEDTEGGRWLVRRTVVVRNTGAVPLRLRAWRLAGEPCRGRGFRLAPCTPLALAPNESRALTLAFRADCTLARVPATLTLRAGAAAQAFRVLAAVPARLLPACAAALPRPPWEPALRAAGSLLALTALALVLAAAALDAERLLRRARERRHDAGPRAPLDLRALARDPPPAPAPAPPRRRRPPRRAPAAPDPAAERQAFERWRAEVLRRDSPRAEDESSRSSEDADVPPAPRAATPPPPPPRAPPDDYETEPDTEPPRSSGDDDAASTGTDSSSPPDDEPEPPGDRTPPTVDLESSPPLKPQPNTPPPETKLNGTTTKTKERREETPPRRTEPPGRARAPPGKHHARKDKVSKRRERPAPAPARPSPAPAEPRGPPGATPPALRWGASWSSVVAAAPGAPPAAPRPSDSLFYFNDAHAPAPPLQAPPPEPDYAWRGPERSPFNTPPREYIVPDEPTNLTNNAYGTIGSLWTAAEGRADGAWVWGAAVRPPPGFAPRAPPPVRAFDPFHSLASIWAPAAFDWRADPRAPRDPRPPHDPRDPPTTN